ncbi:MAG: competence/damage-inducible protein A [Nitrospiraceae bacterium]|nr:competence/damage-inducible protein A [Nitrospiraceae bacterium]MDA8208545.1 competence/damage-inducible protein A [Actinomycetota bacterium]
MRVEIVAVGTEMLLGQIVDTNSREISAKLAEAGIDCHYQTRVGDNLERIKLVLRDALARNDGVIVCGGLGPTQDDITRDAIAQVMGVELVFHREIADRIAALFAGRGREMSSNNLRQAEVPRGAEAITQVRGTAPGLICPVGGKVIYALPGVPYEMSEMMERAVIPDLLRRSGEDASIVSRVIRTWGLAESTLAERLDPVFKRIDASGDPITLAFLASGIEGIKARLTAKGARASDLKELVARYEEEVMALVGDHVFGFDDVNMEAAVGRRLQERGLTLAVAESLTGGLVASRLVGVAGASAWFKGGVVSYASSVKFEVLGVPEGEVISEPAALAMAAGVRELLHADVGLAFTGVAGPDSQEGHSAGTVFVGIDAGPLGTRAAALKVPGDRERIRQFSAISGLDLLRRFLP